MIQIASALVSRALIYVLVLAIGFVGGWIVNGWRLGNQIEAERTAFAEAALAAQQKAAIETARLQKGIDDARTRLDTVAATIATKDAEIDKLRLDLGALRATANRLRRDAGGLREQLAAYRARDGQSALSACDERVSALARLAADGAGLLAAGADVVAESGGLVERSRAALQGCARDQQRAAAIAQELIASWPKPITTTATQ